MNLTNPDTGNPELNLVAGIYRQAVKDATKGNRQAVRWLDYTAPEWRTYAQQKSTKSRPTRRKATDGQRTKSS